MFKLTSMIFRVRSFVSHKFSGAFYSNAVASFPSSENFTTPPPMNAEKHASFKLNKIADDIASLSLLEVAELSSMLKKKLNLPDMQIMQPAANVVPGQVDEEEAAPQKVQTSFKVKLTKFDEKQKVALIKEIKNLLEGMNLVQAKKFVESIPTVVKEDLSKDEAEKLKEALVNVGGVVEIE